MFKYNVLILSLFLFALTLVDKTYAYFINDFPLVNKVIYIDPGHGGVDPGAIYKDMKESDINLNFSYKIGEKLEELGATVYYTRTGDYDLSSTKNGRKKSDLSNRVKLINDSKSDLYLSIHVNSEATGKWYGPQVFYTLKNDNNEKLAECVQKKLKNNKISKRNHSIISGVYMYDRINIPGILIEVGFLSNYSDRINLNDEKYLEKFAEIIKKGVAAYFD